MEVKITYENDYGESIEFSKDSGIRISAINDLSSNSVQVSTASGAGQVGASVTGKKVQPKTITFEGAYRYDPAIRRKLLNVILPGVDAKIRYQDLDAGLDVYLDGTPTMTPSLSDNPFWQNFQFDFFCAYPYWKGIDGELLEFVHYESAFKFPYTFSSTVKWKLTNKIINQLSYISNQGSVPIGFVAKFKARDTVVGPELLKVLTQENIRFSGLTMQVGDQLVISTIPNDSYCRITRASNGVEENVFYLMDFESSFFMLDKGDNPLRFDAVSGYENLDVTVEYYITYAGV